MENSHQMEKRMKKVPGKMWPIKLPMVIAHVGDDERLLYCSRQMVENVTAMLDFRHVGSALFYRPQSR